MAKKQRDPQRHVSPSNGFPRGRLIWARLFEAEAMEEGQDKSYSCAILFKAGTNLKALRRGFDAAVKDQWASGKLPRKSKSCFIENGEISDLMDDYDYIEEGDVILKLRRYEKFGPPQLVDQQVEVIESPSELYSGCYVLGDVEFYGWERPTGSGISCRLNCLQKVREGDALGGTRVDPNDVFKPVDVDNDDDDDAPPARSKTAAKGKPKSKPKDDDDDDDLI